MDLPQVDVTWVIYASLTVLLLTYFWSSRRNPKYPPCPLRVWPIIGNLLQLNPDPREQFVRFRKQYGDIYSIYLGHKHVVILNGFDVIKETLVKQADNYSDRAVIYADIASGGTNRGLVTSSGAVWKENRTFSLAVLRRFGFGKNILADKIQEEINHLMERLESFNGEPTNIHYSIMISVSNIMCSFIVGQRYDYEDKEFLRLQDIVSFIMSECKGTALFNSFPWLRFLPGDFFSCKSIERCFTEFFDIFAKAHMTENEAVVGEPGNYIAAYLQEMQRKEEAGEKTYLDKYNLLKSILDLFIGGSETTTATLEWFFLYMINFPNVQEKVFQEINEVIGIDRTPCMQDKTSLPYLVATIMEVQRMVSLAPIGFPRMVSRDLILRDYVIPKGTEILVNYDSILHDPSTWGNDVDKFRPERFIAEDGSLLSPETWLPFSIGRRVCLGESMAKMELFLFISHILQRFQILPVNPKTILPMKGHLGLTHTPFPYNLRLVSRR